MNESRLEAASSGGRLSFSVRIFGWCMLAALAVFLINSILTLQMKWPGPAAALGDGGGLSWVQLLIYAAGFALAISYVRRNGTRSLRQDGKKISEFNAFLVRGAFWAVLLVGIVDATISFLRIEGLLESVVGADLTRELGRPLFRGPYVHMPLLVLGFVIGGFTRTLGFQWLALLIVVAELAIVFTRFIFSYEQAFMGDLVRFWYAALFLFASAYTLLEDGHVRVDVFYAGFGPKKKGFVNAWGSLLLGISLCWTIMLVGFGGKSAIIYSPVANFEISQSGFGMYVKYWMAGFLGVFAITMMIQFVSYLMESTADYLGEPGHEDHDTPTAMA